MPIDIPTKTRKDSRMRILAATFVTTLALTSAAFAQSAHVGHGASPSDKAFMDSMEKMDKSMKAPMSGDADKDFVTMMIPHHQGAIDMAKVELQYGKDPVLRKLAQDIIVAQEKEIADMKAWQAKGGK
jgi:uncharacterized protein (DUF305 family)